MVFIALLIGLILSLILYFILRNPFHYPTVTYQINISGRRNLSFTDALDEWLCDPNNRARIGSYEQIVNDFLDSSEEKSEKSSYRAEQLIKEIDQHEKNAIAFETVRKQTRYKQRNYHRSAYTTYNSENIEHFNLQDVKDRIALLEKETSFYCSISKARQADQRKLMTPKLRKMIAERDNYTCQICHKYMPDGIGLQIDHIVPVAEGGKTVPSNLRVLCSKCNGKKGRKIEPKAQRLY